MIINPAIEALIDEIREDKTHGASQLARQALDVMKAAAAQSRSSNVVDLRREVQHTASRLKDLRPSMVPIFNSVRKLEETIEHDRSSDLDSLRRNIISRIEELVQVSIEALNRIAAHASGLVCDGDVILTHSYSSTVAAALKKTYQAYGIRVIATRSGAGRTGERLVWELGLAGVPVTFIDDTAAGVLMSSAKKVFVGADRICSDGGLVNGVGTYMVALAAKKAGAPFYVLCETLKFDSRMKSSEVELEEKDPQEVALTGTLPAGTTVKNPYFDVTPGELITGIVTENGIYPSPARG
ncbi:MAG TPA: translation initiation factor eIF-2B [Dehalococcoidales bacterium]